MKFILLFLIVFCFGIRSHGQLAKLKIPLAIETKSKSSHNGYLIARTTPRWDIIKNLPEGCDSLNSFLKRIKLPGLSHSVLSCDSLFILFVQKPSENSSIILDENKNFDFTDDTVYQIDAERQKEICIRNIPYNICTRKTMITKSIDLCLSFDPGDLVFKNEQERASFVAVGLATYLRGQFKERLNVSAEIAVFLQTPALAYDSENTIIKLLDIDSGKEKEFKIGDVFYLGNKKYKIKKIDKFGRTLYISKLGKRGSTENGVDSGYFAPNFRVNGINGEQIILKRFEGRYVLLDFWGTWCGPCIASIPSLRAMKVNYKDLELISIAAESEKSVSRDSLIRATKKYGMNWYHVYQSFSSKKSLMTSYKINTYPTTLLIDPKGMIVFRGGSAQMSILVDILKLIYKL